MTQSLWTSDEGVVLAIAKAMDAQSWLRLTGTCRVLRSFISHGPKMKVTFSEWRNSRCSLKHIPDTVTWMHISVPPGVLIREANLPPNLELLLLSGFNEPLIGWDLPRSLKVLSLGLESDHPVVSNGVAWELPSGLTKIELGGFSTMTSPDGICQLGFDPSVYHPHSTNQLYPGSSTKTSPIWS